MDQNRLLKALADLPLGAVRYFDRVGSTNDEAATWAGQGAPDLALVIAEQQLAGRGRLGRAWVTTPGSSLAFSVVLYPTKKSIHTLPRWTALGALAVREALQDQYGLSAQIKWPNDVLVNRQKIAGILCEVHWEGDQLRAFILGIGINIAAGSVNGALQADGDLRFPATCVEAELGFPVDRIELLHHILDRLATWRGKVSEPEFLQAWENSLAFRGEQLKVISAPYSGSDEAITSLADQTASAYEGQCVGLALNGSLKLRVHSGEIMVLPAGEVHLRPVEMAEPR